jgi:hydroxymethylglutaryl-CoA reductase (NADPH)
VHAVIAGLGRIHGMFYGKEAELRAQPWLGHVMSAPDAIEMEELWQAYAERMDELPDLPQSVKDFQQESVRTIRTWWPQLERMPRTLIHGDFTPRNLFLRGDPRNPSVCVYDWEVAMMNLPQVDLVEFLAFTLGTCANRAHLLQYIELHRRSLSEATGQDIDPAMWMEGFRLALREFVIRRLPRYVLGVLIFPKRVGVPDIGRFLARILALIEEPVETTR